MWGTKSASYNLCVFDLGEQIVNSNECCDEVVKIKTRSEGGDGGKISCVANHGGKNCSNAFSINNGRCTFNPNVCMDYNGWFTDCVNGKVSNFPGSDCDNGRLYHGMLGLSYGRIDVAFAGGPFYVGFYNGDALFWAWPLPYRRAFV